MNPSYRESLRVPAGWWGMTAFLAFTFVVAVWAILDLSWALGAAVVLGALVLAVLGSYGSASVVADSSGLRADRARIDWQWIAGAEALDKDATREAIARAADGRGWLLIRPYLDRAVRIRLDDPADPHTHWLVGTRHPEALAAAVNGRVLEEVAHD